MSAVVMSGQFKRFAVRSLLREAGADRYLGRYGQNSRRCGKEGQRRGARAGAGREQRWEWEDEESVFASFRLGECGARMICIERQFSTKYRRRRGWILSWPIYQQTLGRNQFLKRKNAGRAALYIEYRGIGINA